MSDLHFDPHDPSTWTSVIRCPACLGEAQVAEQLKCSDCGRVYPVVDGIPYLSVVDDRWHENLREIINYVYFYDKILNDRIEKDRLESNPEHQKATFEMMSRALEESLSHIPFDKTPLLADIGAGMGETSQFMAQRGATVVATDINCIDLKNPRFLTISRPAGNLVETVKNAKPIPREDILFSRVQCDSSLLPLASGSFDVVFNRGTWHHYYDLENVIAECARILKPNGLLVVCSEPLRAREDDELEYLRDVIDYQEGINERVPAWEEYSAALSRAGFEDIEVYGLSLFNGMNLSRRLSKWWNFWRRKSPGPVEGVIFRGRQLERLHNLAGCINLIARKNPEGQKLQRLSVGQPLVKTGLLTNIHENLTEINAAFRSSFPEGSCPDRIECVSPPRFLAFGLRPPEDVDIPFSFCHRITRFYLSVKGERIHLALFALPEQSGAGMNIDIIINDEFMKKVAVDWQGEKTFDFALTASNSPVVELRIEHDRLWQGSFPEGSKPRDLGVGFLNCHTE